MSSKWELDVLYADLMSNHPFGIALYRPQPRSLFNPGSVGYFDKFGAWNPIAHLEDGEALAAKGLSQVKDKLEKAPVDNGIKWGPKTSSGVRERKIEFSGGLNPIPGFPVTASAVFSYSTDKDDGAILLTNSPITFERYYHSTPFKTWCKENALHILKNWEEVKEYGLWIITSVHSTKKCAINMWQTRRREFKVGFDANIATLGELGPNGDWHLSQTDEGWGEYTTDGDDKSVVFFGGLKFQYTWIMGKNLKSAKGIPPLRGERGEEEEPEIIETFSDAEDEQQTIVLDCEEYSPLLC